MKTSNLIKILLYTVFIAGIVISVTVQYYFPHAHTVILNIIFSISLAGLVGIGTNTIAIKMLFRPLNKTFFGRQGLLPKNKEKIAQTLAQTVKERIINRKAILNYLTEEEKLEKIIKKLTEFIEKSLKDKEFQNAILNYLNKLKQEEFTEKNLEKAANFLEQQIESIFESQRFSFGTFFNKTRRAIANEKSKNPLIQEGITTIKLILQKLVSNNSSKIAKYLNTLIDKLLYEKSMLAYYVKRVFINEENLKKAYLNFLKVRKC